MPPRLSAVALIASRSCEISPSRSRGAPPANDPLIAAPYTVAYARCTGSCTGSTRLPGLSDVLKSAVDPTLASEDLMGRNLRSLSVPGAPLSAPSVVADVQRCLPVGRGNERDGPVREGLHATVRGLGDQRVDFVVAPVGSGKTTLLRHFSAATSAPVVWYQAEPSDRSVADLLRHLQAAFEAAVGALAASWTTIEGAVTSLQRISAARLVLVLDDLYYLEATPAEAALERLVTYAPGGMALLAASHYPPGFNVPRLRLCGKQTATFGPAPSLASCEASSDLASGGRPVEAPVEAPTELGRLDAGVVEPWAEAGLTLALARREGRRWSGR